MRKYNGRPHRRGDMKGGLLDFGYFGFIATCRGAGVGYVGGREAGRYVERSCGLKGLSVRKIT